MFNQTKIEVRTRLDNYLPHKIVDIIKYPCHDRGWFQLIKGVPCYIAVLNTISKTDMSIKVVDIMPWFSMLIVVFLQLI